jgi:hypothetical protein
MPEAKILAAVVAIVLGGGLAACGDNHDSSSGSASKTDFCRTFNQLGSDTSPQHAADELSRVGTPGDIGSSARRGFDILVEHLRDLRSGANPGDVTQMVKDLDSQDADDVRSFVTYYVGECQKLPADSSS